MKAMRVILFLIVVGLVGGLIWAFHANQVRSSAGPRATYTSEAYQLSFSYPADWQPVAGTKDDRFEGESGFFEVTAAGEDGKLSLDDIVGGESGKSSVNPYGTSPFVEPVEADGRDARLILPSPDADPALKGQSALVTTFPDPVTIGGVSYEYLVIYGDQYHIRGIADSLKFLK